MSETREIRLKRLAMRAGHRGIKEMDIILGSYVGVHLAGLDDAALDRFEELLGENDHDLYQWVSGQREAPERFAPLVEEITAHMHAHVSR